MSPDLIRTAIAVLGFLGTVCFSLWRASQWVHELGASQVSLAKGLAALQTQIASSAVQLADLAADMAGMAQGLHEREKDVLRLEGRMDQTNTLIVQTIGSLQGVQGSTDALWRSLQKLHPNEVPRRASDRTKGS